MTRLLSLFGLMRVSEHERLLHHKILHPAEPATDWEAKFKQAVADLEKQDLTIAEHRASFVELTNEIASLRPDALAMRRKRQMDRDRRKGNG